MSNVNSNNRGVVLDKRAREIIINVDNYFRDEKRIAVGILNELKNIECDSNHGEDVKIPRKTYEKLRKYIHKTSKLTDRLSLATGISNTTIVRIRQERCTGGPKHAEISAPKKRLRSRGISNRNLETIALQSIFNTLYLEEREIPRLKKIYAVAKNDYGFPRGLTTLRNFIKSIGYSFKNCKDGKGLPVFVERPKLRAIRAQYLKRIRQNVGKKKRPVIYLDETWIAAQHIPNNLWQPERKCDKENRWILAHAGGENGFVNADVLLYKAECDDCYNSKIMETIFTDWLIQQLIPNLPKNAIIVMNYSFYRYVEERQLPDLSSDISEVRAWLTENNIDFPDNLTKSELLEIIKMKEHSTKGVDDILIANGFEVLRIPPFNCDLNAIEYIWHSVKQRVTELNVDQSESKVEAVTRQAIASVTRKEWEQAISHVKEIEKKYLERERLENEKKGPFSILKTMGDYSDDNSDSATDM